MQSSNFVCWEFGLRKKSCLVFRERLLSLGEMGEFFTCMSWFHRDYKQQAEYVSSIQPNSGFVLISSSETCPKPLERDKYMKNDGYNT